MTAANDNVETLIDHASYRFNWMTGQSIANLFNALQMPIPRIDEITTTRDKGYILFLNEVASVMRFTPDAQYPAVTDDHVLQPYGRVETGRLRVDFLPGVMTPVSEQDDNAMISLLAARGISYNDFIVVNSGYLPGLKSKHCVNIDPGSIRARTTEPSPPSPVNDNFAKATGFGPAKLARMPVQAAHYRHLREAFNAAWATNKAIDPSGLTALWNTCRAMKHDGLMVTDWLDHYGRLPSSTNLNDHRTEDFSSRDYKNMVEGSRKYQERWGLA
jgi:hypothetical protein